MVLSRRWFLPQPEAWVEKPQCSTDVWLTKYRTKGTPPIYSKTMDQVPLCADTVEHVAFWCCQTAICSTPNHEK